MARRDLGDRTVEALTRPGVGSALLAALGVYLVFTVPSLLSQLLYQALTSPTVDETGGLYDLAVLNGVRDVLVRPIPLAVGVFIAFWQVAPIAPQLRMAHVVTRSLLAALVGSVLSLALAFVLVLAPLIPALAQGATLPQVAPQIDVATTLVNGSGLLTRAAVAVPLAALLLWGWLQSHPPKSTARGALDEV